MSGHVTVGSPKSPVKGQRIAFVTGGTSGIGEAVAELFCKRGIAVIICGRRVQRLRDFQKRMEGRAPVYPLMFDVTDNAAVVAAVRSIPEEWRAVNILVNNAGISFPKNILFFALLTSLFWKYPNFGMFCNITWRKN